MSKETQRKGPKLKVQVWVYRDLPNGSREVLLLRLKAERGGYWQPVTGGVDDGETLGDAALREAQEETGLDFAETPRPLGYEFRFYSPRHKRECEEHVYAVAVRGPSTSRIQLDPHEHVDSAWVPTESAEAQLKHPSNIEGLRRLK